MFFAIIPFSRQWAVEPTILGTLILCIDLDSDVHIHNYYPSGESELFFRLSVITAA